VCHNIDVSQGVGSLLQGYAAVVCRQRLSGRTWLVVAEWLHASQRSRGQRSEYPPIGGRVSSSVVPVEIRARVHTGQRRTQSGEWVWWSSPAVAVAVRRESLLAQLRRRAGLTQKAVAEQMGVTQARVSAIEGDDIASTEASTLIKYASALAGKAEITVVVGGDEQPVLG
jgi:DNA-binding XRE family transcriptional regulator